MKKLGPISNTLVGLRSVDNWHYKFTFSSCAKKFAGNLQLPIKVLNQTGYAIYRAVIQSCLTAYVQFHRYVANVSMNSTANGSSGSWSCLNFSALKIGGTVTYCLIIIVSLVANCLIAITVCKTPNLKKNDQFFHRKHGLIWFVVSSILDTF